MTKIEIEAAIAANQEATKSATANKDFKLVSQLLLERSKLLQQLSEITISEMQETQTKFKEELKGNMFYNMFF